jgi:hypothetical protein
LTASKGRLSGPHEQLRRPARRLQALPVLEAEPGETPHSVTVFLVERAKLEPEISLREKRTQLFLSPPR